MNDTDGVPARLAFLRRPGILAALAAAATLLTLIAIQAMMVPQSALAQSPPFGDPNYGHFDSCNDDQGQQLRDGLYLYSGVNFTGKCSRLLYSTPDMNLTYVGLGSASSLRLVTNVPISLTVTLYDTPFYLNNAIYFQTPANPGIYFIRDLSQLSINQANGQTVNVSFAGRIRSLGIATAPDRADQNAPIDQIVYGPEAPPNGVFFWTPSNGARVSPPVQPGGPSGDVGPFCTFLPGGCGPNPDPSNSTPPSAPAGGATIGSGTNSVPAFVRTFAVPDSGLQSFFVPLSLLND